MLIVKYLVQDPIMEKIKSQEDHIQATHLELKFLVINILNY